VNSSLTEAGESDGERERIVAKYQRLEELVLDADRDVTRWKHERERHMDRLRALADSLEDSTASLDEFDDGIVPDLEAKLDNAEQSRCRAIGAAYTLRNEILALKTLYPEHLT
jgi:hypothetical protein